jgi:hypothetical protein
MKNTNKLRMGVGSAVVLLLVLASAANGQGDFPDAPGRDTLFLVCSQCHSIGKINTVNLTAADWQFIVYDMISRGAPVYPEDIKDLTKYLQDNFASDRR